MVYGVSFDRTRINCNQTYCNLYPQHEDFSHHPNDNFRNDYCEIVTVDIQVTT